MSSLDIINLSNHYWDLEVSIQNDWRCIKQKLLNTTGTFYVSICLSVCRSVGVSSVVYVGVKVYRGTEQSNFADFQTWPNFKQNHKVSGTQNIFNY